MKYKKILAAIFAAVSAMCCFYVSAGAAQTGNLLTGGDFETGTLTSIADNWKFPTTGIWYSGGDIKKDTETDNAYVSMSSTGLGQKVTVEANTTYVLTARIKSTGTAAFAIQNGSAVWPGTMPGSTFKSVDVSSSNEWTEYTVEYTTGTGQTSLVAYLWANSDGTTCIDDVKLVEVDAAESYSYTADEALKYTDAKGFTYTFTPGSTSVSSLSWYLKSGEGDYKKLKTVTMPELQGEGAVMAGLIVYNVPDNVTNLSAGVSIE